MKKCIKCQIIKNEEEFHKLKFSSDGYRSVCKECRKKDSKLYYSNNKEKIINASKSYQKQYYIDNKDKISSRNKEYEKKFLQRRNDIRKFRRDNDIEYNLTVCLRARVSKFLTGKSKSKNTKELLGCSLTEFKIYLESLFKEGMSWDNHGFGNDKWHIDHIKPCCQFDLTKLEEQAKCFHYSNMQPLWQKENLSKGKKSNTI